MQELEKKILEIANKNTMGFTIYVPSCEFVKFGWVIANVGTQNNYGITGLRNVLEYAMKHNRIIGGYKNEKGVFQWDASIVEPNKQLAISLMILHNQDCIFNLETSEYLKNDLK